MFVIDVAQRSVAGFAAESRLLGAGRSVMALAQASVLAFTPAAYLFVPVGGADIVTECGRFPQAGSAYCLLDGLGRQAVSWILLGLLLVVASGLLPRVTSFIHLWVALSVNSAISLPDGGEAIAQVCTVFIALACLNDRRLWHWQRPRPAVTDSVLQGVAWGGLWGLRLQLAWVYLNSAVAKVSVAPWQDGTATYYVARMENFGAAGLFAPLIHQLTSIPLVAVATTWGAIAAEASMAVLLLGGRRRQLVALALCCALHLSIIVQLGIVSFGLMMIGAVACSTSRGAGGEVSALVRRWRDGRRPAAPTDAETAEAEGAEAGRAEAGRSGSERSGGRAGATTARAAAATRGREAG